MVCFYCCFDPSPIICVHYPDNFSYVYSQLTVQIQRCSFAPLVNSVISIILTFPFEIWTKLPLLVVGVTLSSSCAKESPRLLGVSKVRQIWSFLSISEGLKYEIVQNQQRTFPTSPLRRLESCLNSQEHFLTVLRRLPENISEGLKFTFF